MGRNVATLTRGKLNPTVTQTAYLAGVIDSDGCIAVSKMHEGMKSYSNFRYKNPRYVLTLNITNTSEELMEWLLREFGGNCKARRKEKAHHKITYGWHYNNGKAAEILKLVEPYLIVRKKQAQLAIDLISGWKTEFGRGALLKPDEVERREKAYLEMKRLNRTGLVSAAATTKSPGSCNGSQDDAIV